jgi:hypothetical protein
MKPIKPLFTVCVATIVAVAISLTCMSDDSLMDSVKGDIEIYDFTFSESLQEYYMDVDFEAESSADAPLLFVSKGKMRRLQTRMGEYEYCAVNPQILSDERTDSNERPLSTSSTDEHIVVDGKTRLFVQTPFSGTGNITNKWLLIDEQYRRNKLLPEFRCIHLADWPFITEMSFDSTKAKPNILRNVYLGGSRCFRARQISGKLVESAWATAPKANGLTVLQFRDGLPVKRQVYVFRFNFEPEKELPDIKNGTLACSVETQWAKLPGDIDVPSIIHATFIDKPFESLSSIQFVAKIKVFLPDSPEYTTAFSKFEEIRRQTASSDGQSNDKK